MKAQEIRIKKSIIGHDVEIEIYDWDDDYIPSISSNLYKISNSGVARYILETEEMFGFGWWYYGRETSRSRGDDGRSRRFSKNAWGALKKAFK